MIDALAGRPWVHAVGLSLLQFLWQGAIVAMLTALALTLFREASARARYGIACIGLGVMWIAAVTTLAGYAREHRPPDSVVSPAVDAGVRAAQDATSIPAGTADSTRAWSRERIEAQLPRIVIVWAAGVFVLTLHLLISWLLVERLRRSALHSVPDGWLTRIRAIGSSLGVTRAVRVMQSSILDVPTVIGWLRPTILLPASLVGGISPFQLEAVLAHELAHIRRHDYLVNVLQGVTETLLFYHPGVWWVSRQIRREREYCCDDLAAEVCGDRVAYARALTSLEERRAGYHVLAVAATGGDLLGRVRRLLGVPIRTSRPSVWVALSASLSIATLVLAKPPSIVGTATADHPADHPTEVAIPMPVRSEQATAQAPRDPVVAASRRTLTAEEQVRLVEEQYRVAKLHNDVAALDRLLDDACVETNQNGNTRNKAELLELWRDFRISSLVIDSLNLRVTGDTVVATGRMTERNAGIDYMLFTRTWKSAGNGQWKLVSSSQFRDPNVSATQTPGWLSQADLESYRSATNAMLSALAQATGQTTPAPIVQVTPHELPGPIVQVTPHELPGPVIRVGGDIKEPKKIEDVRPRYPDDAKAAGVQGVVIMEVTLDTEGNVADVRIIRSIPLLDQAALDAVRQWKFTPTLLNGVPVSVLMTVTVAFSLG
jgi:TonB family protein